MPEFDDTIYPGLSASNSFGEFFEAHSRVVNSIRKYSLKRSVSLIGGMMTLPEFQASTLRLEVLQHFVVASATGILGPWRCSVRAWLNRLGDGYVGRLEDPAEDVFVSRVSYEGADHLVFEGLYEGSHFYLQRFLNVLADMPDEDPFGGIKNAVEGLLRLSNEVVKRASLAAFTVGATEPVRVVSRNLVKRSYQASDRVTFSAEDLAFLGVAAQDIDPFVFDLENRHVLQQDLLGHSLLERHPMLNIGENYYFALPTAVSMAIRRLIIEFCLSEGLGDALYGAYTDEVRNTFGETPMLGARPSALPRFQSSDYNKFANMARYVDQGRLLHLCFIIDNFESYDETGVVGFAPNHEELARIIDRSVEQIHNAFHRRSDFREGLTLVVLGMWARPMAMQFEGVDDTRWRFEFISAADLESISWISSFSPTVLWSLLDARRKLSDFGVDLFNINGLLNLYAWSESLEGHLIPHGRMPDDSRGEALNVYIEQNSLLEIRRKSAQAWNVHRAQTWDGRSVSVRRHKEDAIFEEDRNQPLYVSLDDIERHQLVAVFETPDRGWWVTVQTPNTDNRELHYRLWHAVVVWLERSANVLDSRVLTLPKGPIAWMCTFEDEDPSNPRAEVPNRDEARALLEVEAEGNIVSLTARQGFLFSFRHPTNVGESLLVEALVDGTTQLSSDQVTAEDRTRILAEIIPDEWARDMHFFSAQRFRDFVGQRLHQDTVLIEKVDDALMRIGRGWKVRDFSEGPRIEGVDSCCSYLNEVVESIWEGIQSELVQYRRETLVSYLVSNHEAITMEADQWLRTARSVLAFHRDKEATARESVNQISRFNGGSLSTRILIEMALCECPDEGMDAGSIDISRLMASVMQMHVLGGWSEAIRYGGKKPEVRITPLGDVHTHVEFDESIATPYGQALGVTRFRDSATRYEDLFKEKDPVATAEGNLEQEFWDAWTEAFDFSIDDVRVFMDNLDDEGIRRGGLFYVANGEEIAALAGSSKLPNQVVTNILGAFSLKPRPTWSSTPDGFEPKDWYPWRFRRRLSVISRPILQLGFDDSEKYLIAPGMIRDGVAKVLDYCYTGGYDARAFPEGRMRSWIGAAENLRGHQFNSDVAQRLRDLGWQARSDIKLSEILNAKLERNYGDIDVLAWRDSRVLAIECKDLELAMTTSDVARQLYDFRGEYRPDGKPDRLAKHLARLSKLHEEHERVRKFVRSSPSVTLEGMLVFSQIVPMLFADIPSKFDVRIATIEDVSEL